MGTLGMNIQACNKAQIHYAYFVQELVHCSFQREKKKIYQENEGDLHMNQFQEISQECELQISYDLSQLIGYYFPSKQLYYFQIDDFIQDLIFKFFTRSAPPFHLSQKLNNPLIHLHQYKKEYSNNLQRLRISNNLNILILQTHKFYQHNLPLLISKIKILLSNPPCILNNILFLSLHKQYKYLQHLWVLAQQDYFIHIRLKQILLDPKLLLIQMQKKEYDDRNLPFLQILKVVFHIIILSIIALFYHLGLFSITKHSDSQLLTNLIYLLMHFSNTLKQAQPNLSDYIAWMSECLYTLQYFIYFVVEGIFCLFDQKFKDQLDQ
ncbi:transmembrane protein, putative (macronuclear) [Tetrahymena thermophila SB210]|uniref:Transmembrane protein, putative n=1 Tax=Tetrahymena thermophila (strain SB210) TaxID=312017 RepID=W7X5H7_TETTS|nr:transmembrane protein, putative [Tetrahymena thermophila SB210]EWS74625.1 transmembrane protein, putative [Tetrahymena thermophila SB210]|eukprot:XP_012652847.1 transmembrane protein, putative [Tetrahymena thermophila SB210]